MRRCTCGHGGDLYRGYHVRYDPPPIPIRSHDWQWWHEDYDGPGDPRCGTAATISAAMDAIDEQIEEMEEAAA